MFELAWRKVKLRCVLDIRVQRSNPSMSKSFQPRRLDAASSVAPTISSEGFFLFANRKNLARPEA